jgi:hypothetical protein
MLIAFHTTRKTDLSAHSKRKIPFASISFAGNGFHLLHQKLEGYKVAQIVQSDTAKTELRGPLKRGHRKPKVSYMRSMTELKRECAAPRRRNLEPQLRRPIP